MNLHTPPPTIPNPNTCIIIEGHVWVQSSIYKLSFPSSYTYKHKLLPFLFLLFLLNEKKRRRTWRCELLLASSKSFRCWLRDGFKSLEALRLFWLCFSLVFHTVSHHHSWWSKLFLYPSHTYFSISCLVIYFSRDIITRTILFHVIKRNGKPTLNSSWTMHAYTLSLTILYQKWYSQVFVWLSLCGVKRLKII